MKFGLLFLFTFKISLGGSVDDVDPEFGVNLKLNLISKRNSTDDCAGISDEEQYCASNDVCLRAGKCFGVYDCANMDNIFPVVLCVGTIECQEGMCAMSCNGKMAMPSMATPSIPCDPQDGTAMHMATTASSDGVLGADIFQTMILSVASFLVASFLLIFC